MPNDATTPLRFTPEQRAAKHKHEDEIIASVDPAIRKAVIHGFTRGRPATREDFLAQHPDLTPEQGEAYWTRVCELVHVNPG